MPKFAARPVVVATMLGLTQILAFGTSLYLLGVLADFMLADTGWSRAELAFGFTLGVVAAGIVAPRVGRVIHAGRGFEVLAASPFLFAAGLGLMSLATAYPVYLLAWCLLGFGMATGLYDTVFSVLGRKYGIEARFLITTVALLGAFASTCTWPASAFLVGRFGWRGALQGFAAAHLLISLPLILIFTPRHLPEREGEQDSARPAPPVELHGLWRLIFYLLTAIMALGTVVASTLALHLVAILQARGASLGEAVAAAALIGPAQVVARLTDIFFGRFTGALTAVFLSVGALSAGIFILTFSDTQLWLPIAVYGLGLGLATVARGAVPLMLFPVENYATLLGRMSRPILFGQALAPYLAAMLVAGGVLQILSILSFISLLNLGLVALFALLVNKAKLA